MIQLPNVDLIGIDTNHPHLAIESLLVSSACIKFGKIILFTCADKSDFDPQMVEDIEFVKIDKFKEYIDYSTFCLKLNQWCHNDFTLITHYDSFIINPQHWSDEFMKYDYIGAPWAIVHANAWHIKNRVGNGGFCLRSRKMLHFSAGFNTTEGDNEDGFLTNKKLHLAQAVGIKYAPVELAYKFSVHHLEDVGGVFEPNKYFGFHGMHNFSKAKEYVHGDQPYEKEKWWENNY